MKLSEARLPLRPRERAWLENLKLLSALGSDADLLRLAVQHLARHYDADLPLALFQIRGYRSWRRKSA